MRIGTMLSMPEDPTGVAGLVERAVAAEAAGFASVWLPQVGTIDALMTLALAGRDTSTIELATAVVPTPAIPPSWPSRPRLFRMPPTTGWPSVSASATSSSSAPTANATMELLGALATSRNGEAGPAVQP